MSDESVEPEEKNIIVRKPLGNDDPVKGAFQGGSGQGAGSASGTGGWSFDINTGGNAGGSFSGGFGGSSRKKARRRAKARAEAVARLRAEADERARAEQAARQQAQREQARAAHRQQLDALQGMQEHRRAELDGHYAQRQAGLAQQLEQEVRKTVKAPNPPGDERWQLYLISKKKAEIDGLVAVKQAALQARNASASAFDGHDALQRNSQDYRRQLEQHSGESAQAADDLHRRWEQAYIAAHEGALLRESIRQLSEQSRGLSEHYAQEAIRWRKIDEIHEGHRQYAAQRERHISHHLRVEEDLRRTALHAAHTHGVSVEAASRGAIFMGRSDVELARDLARLMEAELGAAVREVLRIAAIRTGQTLAVGISALLYSPALGNGELTPEQRRRLAEGQFQGVGVKADTMGLPADTDLAAIASTGGSVALPARIRPVTAEQGIELQVVATVAGLPAQVPVIQMAPQAETLGHQAVLPGLPQRRLSFDSTRPGTAAAGKAIEHHLLGGALLPLELPDGVDMRFDDCILCFAPESGLEPLYVSFALKPPGHGIVSGHGQPGSADWRKALDGTEGAAIPEQIGERLRWREFHTLDGLDPALWRTLGQDPLLSQGFDPLNVRRLQQGLPPYAPRAHWVGERRHYEIRATDAAAAQGSPFALDTLRIVRPDSHQGVVRFVPLVQPWPTAGVGHTWTPLLAPGADLLGTPESTAAPQQLPLYPGNDIAPVQGQDATQPAADPSDVQAAIPGYAEGDDLPSPDLLFAEPVKVLETGAYDKLERRSRGDGLDVDHILSRAAYIRLVRMKFPELTHEDARKMSNSAPGIVIPKEVHEKYSETFRWKNTKMKQELDARDPEAGVNSNFNAIKVGLLESGFDEADLESARSRLHELYRDKGLY